MINFNIMLNCKKKNSRLLEHTLKLKLTENRFLKRGKRKIRVAPTTTTTNFLCLYFYHFSYIPYKCYRTKCILNVKHRILFIICFCAYPFVQKYEKKVKLHYFDPIRKKFFFKQKFN